MTTRLPKRLEPDYLNVLVAVFELILRSGTRAKDLLPLCVRSLKRAETKLRTSHNDQSDGLITAALVLDRWHRDRRYLSAKGTPKPVRLLGPGLSVEALIRLQKVKEQPADVARRLREFRLIVRCGRGLYQPASDAAVISAHDPVTLQHAARAVLTLLETVGQNLSGARTLAPLIERVAEVPDLPRKHIRAFQTFTHEQGQTLIRTVNDWLETRRARRSSRERLNGTVRAGIHTYAYVAPKRPRRARI